MADITTRTSSRRVKSERVNVVAGEPGYGLGIAGFVVSFFVSLAGLIMSAIALHQSRVIGKKNAFALAGLVIGIIFTVIGLLVTAASIVGVVFLVNYCNAHQGASECSETTSRDSGSGYYQDGGGSTRDPIDKTY